MFFRVNTVWREETDDGRTIERNFVSEGFELRSIADKMAVSHAHAGARSASVETYLQTQGEWLTWLDEQRGKIAGIDGLRPVYYALTRAAELLR